MKNTGVVDYAMIAVGTLYSLANIEQILGIVLLIIQLLWIITKFVYKIYTAIKKEENLDDYDDEYDELIGNIEDLIEDDKDE